MHMPPPQGAIAGILASVGLSLIGGKLMRWPLWPISGCVFGVLLGLIAFVGDLTASMFKRDAGSDSPLSPPFPLLPSAGVRRRRSLPHSFSHLVPLFFGLSQNTTLRDVRVVFRLKGLRQSLSGPRRRPRPLRQLHLHRAFRLLLLPILVASELSDGRPSDPRPILSPATVEWSPGPSVPESITHRMSLTFLHRTLLIS